MYQNRIFACSSVVWTIKVWGRYKNVQSSFDIFRICLLVRDSIFLTHSIPGLWIGLPNSQMFPTDMFFGNCPQKFRCHRTPLKSRQSTKIRTTVVWGAWERKSRSGACRRSNVGLPICLYPFFMLSAVLQIFIKVLNISFFPITLHSLRFMIHAKNKPNNSLREVAFSWASFDLWPTNHINFARCHVQIINKLKI